MGDFNYVINENTKHGMHSITIDPDGLNINTWSSYYMAPKSRPFVSSPPIKEEYVDVPGADGALDYTEVLTGKTRYGRRTGQWEFIVENGHQNWTEFYSRILNTLHGKYFSKIVLDDDPEYCYRGRLTVSGNFSNKDYSSIVIAYNLDPYKYPIGSTSAEQWKWNDLFGNTIYFGTFSVNGKKARTILNEQDTTIECTVNLTNPMTVYDLSQYDDNNSDFAKGRSSVSSLVASGMELYEARIFSLLNSSFNSALCPPIYTVTGDNTFTLKPGKNVLYFVGNGIVTIEYERGKTL